LSTLPNECNALFLKIVTRLTIINCTNMYLFINFCEQLLFCKCSLLLNLNSFRKSRAQLVANKVFGFLRGFFTDNFYIYFINFNRVFVVVQIMCRLFVMIYVINIVIVLIRKLFCFLKRRSNKLSRLINKRN